MEEQFEIDAIRLATLVGQKSHSGQMSEARKIADRILAASRQVTMDAASRIEPKPAACDPLSVHIRWLIRRDLPAALEIEHDSYFDAWGEGTFIRHLKQKNVIGIVAEHQERVVGQMVYALWPRHLALLRFAVGRDWRRRQVGAQMLQHLIGKLCPQRRREIRVIVDDASLVAHLFLKSQGCRCIAIDGDEYRFIYRIGHGQRNVY